MRAPSLAAYDQIDADADADADAENDTEQTDDNNSRTDPAKESNSAQSRSKLMVCCLLGMNCQEPNCPGQQRLIEWKRGGAQAPRDSNVDSARHISAVSSRFADFRLELAGTV